MLWCEPITFSPPSDFGERDLRRNDPLAQPVFVSRGDWYRLLVLPSTRVVKPCLVLAPRAELRDANPFRAKPITWCTRRETIGLCVETASPPQGCGDRQCVYSQGLTGSVATPFRTLFAADTGAAMMSTVIAN